MAEAEDLTQKEAAKRIGISPRQLRTLTTRGDVSRNDDGSYPWPTVREEHRALKAAHEEDRAAGFGDDAYEKARARKTTAQAELAEMQAKKLRGEVVDRKDVAAMVRAPLEAVDRVLKSAPRRHARRWAKVLRVKEAEALELIETLVEDVRTELRKLSDAA